jgi:hypothetical protein
MTKGIIGDQKAFEERKKHESVKVEGHKRHNHQLTTQARAARRQEHKLHTMMKHENNGP